MKSVHFLGIFLSLAVFGCGAEGGDQEVGSDIVVEEAGEDLASSGLVFTKLDVTKTNAKAGLTVLRTASEYQAFFGKKPPTGFYPGKWAVHYAMGTKNTGGYSAEITQIKRVGYGSKRALEVSVTTHAPGPKCMVTMAFTNPQVTVAIKAQSGVKREASVVDAQVDLCGGCVEPSTCPVPKIACKLCEDGSAACPEATCEDGECGFVIRQCPEDQFCGGIAGIACPAGYECVDNPNDGCDPAAGGADCGGICKKAAKPAFCGGFANIQCPKGFTCADDPNDGCDPAAGGADCGGICVEECTGPVIDCAAPPPGCNYVGGGCVNGQWTCGKLSCGESCGDVVCGEGTVCCNPLMGICTKPGMVCIQ